MSAGIARVLEARLYGRIPVPLTVQYDVTHPVAIRITLGTRYGPRTWLVARALVVACLLDFKGPREYSGAAVFVTAIPHLDLALLALRDGPDHWPLTASASQLGAFVARSYELCPSAQEQHLVDSELDALLVTITPEGTTRHERP